MQILTKDPAPSRTNRKPFSVRLRGVCVRGVWLLPIAAILMLLGCGGISSSNVGPSFPLTLSGNWQFNMSEQINPDPTKTSFTGGLQGGFLQQTSGSVKGSAILSLRTLPPVGSGGGPAQCISGTDAITGTISGQAVTLTATSANAQTFALTGTLSLDGSTMTGSYTSTDGAGCGIATPSSQAWIWSATLVLPLAGPVQGSFHSTGGTAGLNEQDFLVSGALSQGDNIGTAYATLSGNLNFLNSLTTLSDYPCLAYASVSGQISGTSVFLQIAGSDGSVLGQIGTPLGSDLQTVAFNSTQNGYALSSLGGAGYSVFAPACGGGSLQSPADSGDICLGVNTTTACQPSITLTPSAIIFPSQPVASPPTLQTIKLANTFGSTLGGVTLALTNNSGPGNFSEADTCGVGGLDSQGQPFDLAPKQSCDITVAFAPQQKCSPDVLPDTCITGTLTVNSPNNSVIVSVPITGGVSPSAASAEQLKSRQNSLSRSSRTSPSQEAEGHAETN